MQESSDGSCQTHRQFYSMMIPYPLFHDTTSFPVYNTYLHLLSPRCIQDNPYSTKLQTATQGSSRLCPRTKTRPGSRNSSVGFEFHAPSTCSQSPESGRGTSCSALCGSVFCLPGQRPRGRDGGGLGGRGPGLIISGFRLPVVKRQMFPKVVDAENRTHFSL